MTGGRYNDSANNNYYIPVAYFSFKTFPTDMNYPQLPFMPNVLVDSLR